ncbi:MAG: DNA polymerase III subunit delta [Bacteroidota bacterium]
MPHTPQQVLTQLQKKQYASVYFLQGEEPYYIDLITNYVEANVLSDAEKGFNLTVVYGKEGTIPTILSHARRFPMGSEYQVVLVKEAQELQDLKKEAGRKLLESYIQSPQPATLLVFAHKYKTLDARRSLSKTLAKQAVLVNSKKLYDNQLGAWITTYARDKGLSITEKATWMLQEYIGNDLERLANELSKICLNIEQSTGIDDVMVQTYVGISRNFNAFELQKALAKKDVPKAQQIVAHFAANPKNNPAIPLVALLFSFFSKLLRLHHAQDKSDAALAKALQVSPYFVQEYITAAKHYPLPKVIENIHHLHQADLQLKGVDYPATPEGQILKELIFKLMH